MELKHLREEERSFSKASGSLLLFTCGDMINRGGGICTKMVFFTVNNKMKKDYFLFISFHNAFLNASSIISVSKMIEISFGFECNLLLVTAGTSLNSFLFLVAFKRYTFINSDSV